MGINNARLYAVVKLKNRANETPSQPFFWFSWFFTPMISVENHSGLRQDFNNKNTSVTKPANKANSVTQRAAERPNSHTLVGSAGISARAYKATMPSRVDNKRIIFRKINTLVCERIWNYINATSTLYPKFKNPFLRKMFRWQHVFSHYHLKPYMNVNINTSYDTYCIFEAGMIPALIHSLSSTAFKLSTSSLNTETWYLNSSICPNSSRICFPCSSF